MITQPECDQQLYVTYRGSQDGVQVLEGFLQLLVSERYDLVGK
jgi:hypothetical protein